MNMDFVHVTDAGEAPAPQPRCAYSLYEPRLAALPVSSNPNAAPDYRTFYFRCAGPARFRQIMCSLL